jgi:hypothetical protein
MGQVIRQLGKVLALVAMMASVVNAQCAMSCSLQSGNPPTVAPKPIVMDVTTHACCPDQVPDSRRTPNCPHPLSHTDEARIENNVAGVGCFTGIQAGPIVRSALTFSLLPQSGNTISVASVNSSGQSLLALIPILRI